MDSTRRGLRLTTLHRHYRLRPVGLDVRADRRTATAARRGDAFWPSVTRAALRYLGSYYGYSVDSNWTSGQAKSGISSRCRWIRRPKDATSDFAATPW